MAYGLDASLLGAFLGASVVVTVILLFSGMLDSPRRRGREGDDDAIEGLWSDDLEA